MLQKKYKNYKIFRSQKIHLLMLILLKIINKKQSFSIFIDVEDKHILQLKVLNIINNNDKPSNAMHN